ncbi:MAG: AraC family transcriptional regulator [Candidatus Accumulibacter sp.]|nr:AraC family transcriptional regulator [Accumulibacter sp.]
MIEHITSVNSHRFQDTRFLNGHYDGKEPVYHIFYFPHENAGFFNLDDNWTDIVSNRIMFISPGVNFSVRCADSSLDCFHISFRSHSAYEGAPCYFSVVPPELRHSFTEKNVALAVACIANSLDESSERLREILDLLDILISESRITFAARNVGSLRDIPQHFHESEYQLEYFAEGVGSICCGNRWMEYSQGSFCFVPPRVPHEIVFSRSSSIDNYSIKFKFGKDSKLSIPAEAFVTKVTDERQPVILGLLKKIVGEYTQDIPISPEKLDSLVSILHEIKNSMNEKDARGNELISQIKQIVNAGISQGLRVSEIAGQVGLSHEYISRQFRKHTGQTLISYINSMRLQVCLAMLKNTNMPLKQVAAECGFKNLCYFYTMFKKHFSMTPREIRRQGNERIHGQTNGIYSPEEK